MSGALHTAWMILGDGEESASEGEFETSEEDAAGEFSPTIELLLGEETPSRSSVCGGNANGGRCNSVRRSPECMAGYCKILGRRVGLYHHPCEG